MADAGDPVNYRYFCMAQTVYKAAIDLAELDTVLPYLWSFRKVPWQQKVALAAVFNLGILVAIQSCLRIASLVISATTPDSSYDIENVV
ncbi:hypothetical protein GMORB2_5312 [Geosmithia morbida]|uniref:Rhodopsin domain-containing protein n=1 Tax=Geosmithia morbida TaxID=1094350 RepID=A0A9P4YZK1_9HYPO|nr:uncharacterized protein GMORB2_5312 [Geosmithia morbida]KAF4124646.1 hypothetical protein GMORB2_5312 [Geosmithia morbida]